MNTKDLTPNQIQAIRIAVAEVAGVTKMYWLLKRGLYWRPNGAGYTNRSSEAGLYTYEEAKAREHTSEPEFNDRVYMEPAEPPNYPADLNAVRDVVMKMGIVPKRCIAENLEKVCEDDLPGDVWGDAFVVQNATAIQRCIAILMVLHPAKWEEIKANP